MLRHWLLIAVAALLGGPAAAQDRPATEEIGSWVLTCPPGGATCQLRHRTWVLPPAGGTPGAALEVAHRGSQFVPVVALRGLSTQAALGGLLTLEAHVSLRLDDGPVIELACGLDGSAVVCIPPDNARSDVAAALLASRNAQVQIRLSLPDGLALPEQTRSLELQRTADALARFRATAPPGAAIPVVAGLDWRGLLDRLARDAGYQQGLAELLGRWTSH